MEKNRVKESELHFEGKKITCANPSAFVGSITESVCR